MAANGTDLRYGWTLDGRAAGTGPRWVGAPEAGQVGRHRVEVTVVSREGTAARAWTTRVRGPRRPAVTGDLGGTATRDWRVHVAPAPVPPPD